MNEPKSPYSYLSRYRSELMGLAILWVVWFHSRLKWDFLPEGALRELFFFLRQVGYGGVDIFLLVSGLGIYRSLETRSLPDYAKNRAKKLLPVWWSYLALWVALELLVWKDGMTFREVLGFAFFTGYWQDLEHQGNWYVYFIPFLYLIAPVLCALLRESRRKTLTCGLLVLAGLALSLTFFENSRILMLFTRIPIFVVGMYFAAALREKPMNGRRWFLCLGLCVLGSGVLVLCYVLWKDYLWDYGLWWYPFLVIAPALSLLLCRGMEATPRVGRPVRFVLRALGKASLEILLISDLLFTHLKYLGPETLPKRLRAFFSLLLGVLLGLVFHWLVEFGKKLAAGKRKAAP